MQARHAEEMAAELAAMPGAAGMARTGNRRTHAEISDRSTDASEGEAASIVRDSQAEAGRSLGMFALGMAIASLFVWPLLLGLSAAALGLYSYTQGARALGIWSVTIGLLAAASYLVFIPLLSIMT